VAQARFDANELAGFLSCGDEAGSSTPYEPAVDNPALIAEPISQVSLGFDL
jgi:hypothetical protein